MTFRFSSGFIHAVSHGRPEEMRNPFADVLIYYTILRFYVAPYYATVFLFYSFKFWYKNRFFILVHAQMGAKWGALYKMVFFLGSGI